MVKTLLSNAETEGSTPGQRAKPPHELQPKNQNVKGNILTNSIKTLKIVHIKKKIHLLNIYLILYLVSYFHIWYIIFSPYMDAALYL